MSLTYAELFAGAGGLSMGLEVAGFHCVAHAEIEPHARAVLRKHWPDCRLDGDVTQINGADYRGITLLSGGSPCQDLSVAGKRAGLVGSRSSLFHEQCRIWRESEAPYLLWENVYGAFSSNGGKDFATVLSTLVGATIAVPADGWSSGGVAAGCDAVAAWRVLDLQHFGPPQRRVRVFVLAARAGGVDPAEVLALSEGVCGHPSPRERSRQIAAGHAAGGVGGGVIPYTASSFAEYEEGVRQLRAAGGDLGGGSETILAFHHRQTPISGDVSPAIGRTTDGMGVMSFGRSSFGGWDGQDVASPVCTHDAKETTSILVMAHGQANASVDLDGCPTLTALHEAPIIVGALCAEDSVKWGTDQWARQNKIITSQTYSTPAIGDIRVDDVASTITKHTGGGGETQIRRSLWSRFCPRLQWVPIRLRLAGTGRTHCKSNKRLRPLAWAVHAD